MPLSGDEIQGLARVARASVKDLINPRSQAFKKRRPDLAAMDDEEVVRLIVSDPRIMKRPVLSDGQRLVTGFAEDEFLSMLT